MIALKVFASLCVDIFFWVSPWIYCRQESNRQSSLSRYKEDTFTLVWKCVSMPALACNFMFRVLKSNDLSTARYTYVQRTQLGKDNWFVPVVVWWLERCSVSLIKYIHFGVYDAVQPVDRFMLCLKFSSKSYCNEITFNSSWSYLISESLFVKGDDLFLRVYLHAHKYHIVEMKIK